MTNNKSIYIKSIEAADLHNHMVRGTEIDAEFSGAIPFSLELIQLKKQPGFKTFKKKPSERDLTNDLINIKFRHNVSSGDDLVSEILPKKIVEVKAKRKANKAKLKVEKNKEKVDGKKVAKLEKSITSAREYIAKLIKQIRDIREELIKPQELHNFEKWKTVNSEELRKNLYTKGFTIRTVNEKTGEITDVKYVIYKRSSSKSRKGEVLAIRQKFYSKMIKWSRMGLKLKENMEIDLAGLLAYESLVGSSLEKLLTIESKNILIVSDVKSKFNELCNVVKTGKDGFLDSFTDENAEVVNELFDGESLLQSDYFDEGQSMMLLRNHMFKSAAFNTNIQQFLQDNCPKGIEYDEWEIDSMFEGEKLLAKNVHLICTPSSLKALKFSHVFKGEGKEKQMWNHWKNLIDSEGSAFGVCKEEHESKHNIFNDGNSMNVTSYQMLNSLPIKNKETMEKLASFEVDYIGELKNNDDFFAEHIRKTANKMNSNEMLADVFEQNKEIADNKLFRDFRKSEIHSYVKKVKKGKIKLAGADYVVLLGNPMEFLQHAIGRLDVTNGVINNDTELALTGNQIYTKLFEDGKELVGFRNPHTSPSNVLVAKNTYINDIDTYFNLSKNIVVVNSVKHNILNKLSGADFDSDSMLLIDNMEDLLPLALECQKYPVCINGIIPEKRPYKLNKEDMFVIDNQLAESQKLIGKTVNSGQFAMSVYWDQLTNGATEKELEGLMKKIDVATVLSGVCIDLAKKLYEINIGKEIRNIESYSKQYIRRVKHEYEDKHGKVKKSSRQVKPQFWVVVSKSETIGDRVTSYDCPMDYLYDIMDNLPPSTRKTKNVEFENLLVKYDYKKSDDKQEKKMLEIVEKIYTSINGVYASSRTDKDKDILVSNMINNCNLRIEKLTVRPATMYATLSHMIKNKSSNATKLMNTLYTTQKDTFLAAFKNK